MSTNEINGADWEVDLTAFTANPSIANYLAIRRAHPDREPAGWRFSGYDPLSAMAGDLSKWGISIEDVAGAMDADHSAIERVALRLLELLDERASLIEKKETHLARRGAAIPDPLIDYLITIMLEGMAEYNEPASIGALNFLIRERLGGAHKSMHGAYLKQAKRQAVVSMLASAHQIPDFEIPSLREIAKALGVNVTSVTRLFEPGELDQLVSAEIKRSTSEGPLIDFDDVAESAEYRALHRNVRAQQP